MIETERQFGKRPACASLKHGSSMNNLINSRREISRKYDNSVISGHSLNGRPQIRPGKHEVYGMIARESDC